MTDIPADVMEKAREISAGLLTVSFTVEETRIALALLEARAEGERRGIERAAKAIEDKHTNNVGMAHPMALSDAAAIRALPATAETGKEA